MGLQGSDRINRDYYNRNVPSEEFIEVAKMIRRHNIVGQYDLITRNPYATEEDMLQICDILSRLPKPYKLETMKLALYPNTPLRQRAIQDGIPVNETDGYTTRFGSYPEKFPHLRDVQEVCQYTPKFLVDFFVSTRNSRAGRALFRAYLRVVYKNIHRLRAAILRNTTLVTWTKKLVFLPITVLRSIRSLFKK